MGDSTVRLASHGVDPDDPYVAKRSPDFSGINGGRERPTDGDALGDERPAIRAKQGDARER